MKFKYKIKDKEMYNRYKKTTSEDISNIIDEKIEDLENMTFSAHMDLQEILYSLRDYLENNKELK